VRDLSGKNFRKNYGGFFGFFMENIKIFHANRKKYLPVHNDVN